ncbi:succinate--CoA ligase [GDP-forming] subunit beta, mitochondrial [Trichoplusia ni]|uniref:Succinate--CoA ligase [GDP-forming] subunit beta, mitochondrial n=1 Tax=Trichoplusia ni TaxID=7111 RepID=A0A7E5VCC1_TRINI|nr:succinate--CoA ligase [GDP-forming] subunit beta, mitochondrial [Trichoplusia ni]XP_026725928.1 succinate--CoA ligase [GDP-forming] subunit beta, mitochondrial [Trichoplusia ni]XP_026725929.1 succinate--CoA ligase [GDP-forming] subunit beta, mitochondrial [Trichoplusia ni]
MAVLKTSTNYKLLTLLAPRYCPQLSARRNLNLQEFHSKDLLRKYQVSIQDFRVIDSKLDSKPLSDFKANEYVVKAQILAGGRGKGHFDNGFKGGVHLTKNRDEILKLAQNMIGHKLITKQTPKDGILVDKVMVAESVNIKRETYFSIVMERSFNGAAIVASPAGGMDIEAVAEKTPHLLKTVPIDIYEGVTDKVANELAEFLEFKGPLKSKCAEEIKKLWELFIKVDATQLEINPLVETDDGRVISVDAKINFDDNANFRQQEIFALDDLSESDPREREAASLNLTYIDMDGSIGCMVNGAGLAMATMDIITLNGGKAANFLDLGGGVGQKQVSAALKILESDPKVKSIFVNVFGGIVNCVTIANGIIAACKENPPKHPLIVRLEGTNSEIALKLLEESGLPMKIINDVDKAAKTAVQLAK